MEEQPHFQTTNTTIEDDEEFYENLEAPKFVDLTLSDPYWPNDRYWFCLRVGCDQKHEEEMDPEKIYKDFVLRVMAARSPNIRLKKALNGNNMSTKMKCPLSAPAKSSKPQETIKIIHSHMNSNPVAKTRQVAAKYMTTPRNKMCPEKSKPFLSDKNPKPKKDSLPANRCVAKALVFHSPEKNTTELRSPLKKICEGMTKAEMESQKRRILGYSSKSAKENGNSKKKLNQDSSRKQLSTCKNKLIQDVKIRTEAIDGDDKENALGCAEETRKKNEKVVQAVDKNLKDGCGSTEVKYKKPKPTNPKPFRLRTDERGILKEANLEKKSHFTTQKEVNLNETAKKVQNLDLKQSRAAGLRRTEIASITPKRIFKQFDEKKESPSWPKQVVRQQGAASHRHCGATKRTSSKTSEPLKPEISNEKL